MSERTRRSEGSERQNSGSGPSGSTAGTLNLGQIRQQGKSFLKAAEDAINNALSGDSKEFLSQSRQQGGQ